MAKPEPTWIRLCLPPPVACLLQACRLRAVKDLFWCAGFYNLAFIHKHYLVCHAPGALVKVPAGQAVQLVLRRLAVLLNVSTVPGMQAVLQQGQGQGP